MCVLDGPDLNNCSSFFQMGCKSITCYLLKFAKMVVSNHFWGVTRTWNVDHCCWQITVYFMTSASLSIELFTRLSLIFFLGRNSYQPPTPTVKAHVSKLCDNAVRPLHLEHCSVLHITTKPKHLAIVLHTCLHVAMRLNKREI